ncbi:hypothetical protein CK203_004119 [Vitis vinifera]|uniref:Uncharacterized protein n=1 Tax=Vitis vinifera TaxID=29760 RepID=A0A438K967_VITVI|nr:hypothetical protein CK203_004119 [Vitis vinifera]
MPQIEPWVRVLVQERHPVAFENRKLNNVEQRKEVIAYITALSEVISDFNEKIKQVAEQMLHMVG